MIIKMRSI